MSKFDNLILLSIKGKIKNMERRILMFHKNLKAKMLDKFITLNLSVSSV